MADYQCQNNLLCWFKNNWIKFVCQLKTLTDEFSNRVVNSTHGGLFQGDKEVHYEQATLFLLKIACDGAATLKSTN